jgi:hypothetical protein
MIEPRKCACVAMDGRDCYAIRYNLSDDDREFDDGECECPCHDEYEEHERDEREAYEDRQYGGCT